MHTDHRFVSAMQAAGASGYVLKDSAFEEKVSIKTIETHPRQLLEKLGLHSVAELTRYAIREGLTPLDAAVH